jgi:hypothetical protein
MPRTQEPVSQKQLEANRANATHSTGPRSPEGKARSAQNARKHGFTAASFSVIHLEDVEFLDNLKVDLAALYQPVNSQEVFALERIALAQLALLRCSALEAGFFTTRLNTSLNTDGTCCYVYDTDVTRDEGVAKHQVRSYCLADGFQRQAAKSPGWTLFLRYQAQTERLYRRAVEEFERLRALRGELPEEIPNEPIAPPEPEETKPLPPSETNPSPPPNLPEAAPTPPSPVPPPPATPATPVPPPPARPRTTRPPRASQPSRPAQPALSFRNPRPHRFTARRPRQCGIL